MLLSSLLTIAVAAAAPDPAASAPEPIELPAAAPPDEPSLQKSLQSMNPDVSFIFDGAIAGFSQDKPLQSGDHDPNKNGFNLQQLELSVSSAVDPFLRFDSNIVYHQEGVEIEEAYATTSSLPWDLQARAGQFLTRFGRLNPTHPHAWEFVDQPFIMSKFMGGEGNRGLGLEASWLTPLPWYGELVTSATEAQGEGTARSFFGAKDVGVQGPLDVVSTTALKQFFPLGPDTSLAWGLSGATGPNSTGNGNRSDILGTDLYLKFRPLSEGSVTVVSLTTEALLRRRQTPGAVLVDYGGYATVFWRFAEQWATAGRAEYGSGLKKDPLDPDWVSDRERFALDLSYWPTEFSRFRLQGSVDMPTWQPDNTYAVFLTMETVVGAHGAHAF
ncbi:MAG: Zinc-regulated TonB-dependent outer rane receptor [Cyanobacteria bacterium RYN_339]|nr:Zinc-regulated TonB-dependent outer rane receptor [Cyanobacteria bacterium RYN_339]